MSKNRRAAAEPEKDKEKDSTSRLEETALDVLSRAATMVEKSENSSPERSGKMSPEPPLTKKSSCERSPSFKERHPKFRKSSTPDYLVALEVARNLKRTNANLTHSSQSDSQSDLNPMDVTTSPNNNSIITEDLPLDMSIKVISTHIFKLDFWNNRKFFFHFSEENTWGHIPKLGFEPEPTSSTPL